MHHYFQKIIVLTIGVLLSLMIGAASADAALDYVPLESGIQGEEVRKVQERLTELGYYKIEVDGDFGEGTRIAVSLFQRVHDLPDTGIIDEETWKRLFSEKVIVFPEKSMVELTTVTFDGTAKVSVQNNLEEELDALTLGMAAYDENGAVYYSNWVMNEENYGLGGEFSITDDLVEAFGSKTYELDIPEIAEDPKIKSIGFFLKGFHTVNGFDYEYAPQQMTICKSDGSRIGPEKPTNPDGMSDKMQEIADTIDMGVVSADIMPWIADFYHDPEGELVISVEKTEYLKDSGMKAGDVIVAINDVPILSGHAWEYAKLELLQGKTITLHYVRYNKEFEVEIG